MTLRKITSDSNVKYVCEVDQLHSEQTPPISKEKRKSASNKKLAQTNESFL